MPPLIKGAYTDDWKAVAAEVKAAAKWCCVRCGHPHDVAAGRCLTVHHFDGDKSNNQRWNLMPLCQACHLSVQARVDPEESLMFEPRLWAMPYIAGFYESGRGVTGPLYNLAKWMLAYTGAGNEWPQWAPIVQRRNA